MNKEEKKVKKEKKIETEENKKEKNPFPVKKVVNIVFWVIIVLGLVVLIDIVCVTKFEAGPFFAIRTKKHDDGGSKEYYGLGYKVIKYNQTNGRIGTTIGTWSMDYIITPTEISMLDLALEYHTDSKETYSKFYNQYLMISGTVETVDNQNKNITLRYTDPDGKYTLDVQVNMYDDKVDLSSYQNGTDITIVGTLKNYENKTDKNPAKLIIENGFIK